MGKSSVVMCSWHVTYCTALGIWQVRGWYSINVPKIRLILNSCRLTAKRNNSVVLHKHSLLSSAITKMANWVWEGSTSTWHSFLVKVKGECWLNPGLWLLCRYKPLGLSLCCALMLMTTSGLAWAQLKQGAVVQLWTEATIGIFLESSKCHF